MSVREEYVPRIKDKLEQRLYLDIIDYVECLNLKIKRSKTKDIIYVVVDKNKKRLLKFTMDKQDNPQLHLKYNLAGEYSEFFHESIRLTIEESNYKYTGCYGCGQCDGTEGYTYHYDDGRTYYRSPSELIELFHFSVNQFEEFCTLLENQLEATKG